MTKTKITIPQQVVDAIGKMKEVYTNFGVVQAMETGRLIPVNLVKSVETLRIWTHEEEGDGRNADRLLDALVNDYDIEVEFKVGETVVYRGEFFEICNVPWIGVVNLRGKTGTLTNVSISDVHHPTPQEIAEEKVLRKWSEIEREVGEIRQGDIGVGNSGLKMICKHEIEKAHALNSLIGFYPTESYVCLLDGDADV